jgi:hypothetical protein
MVEFCTKCFTAISTKGCSVVEYFIVQQEYLSMYDKVNVTRVTDLLSDIHTLNGLTPASIPDHSVLSCAFNLPVNNYNAYICKILKDEMYKNIQYKTVHLSNTYKKSALMLNHGGTTSVI